jgi:hypothetical protein
MSSSNYAMFTVLIKTAKILNTTKNFQQQKSKFPRVTLRQRKPQDSANNDTKKSKIFSDYT